MNAYEYAKESLAGLRLLNIKAKDDWKLIGFRLSLCRWYKLLKSIKNEERS